MFGYVTTNKPELKIREFARYKGFYCGLCRTLRSRHGFTGQMTLSYDMTFLILLLSSLYEPNTVQDNKRCMIHPGKKQMILQNAITEYASDMNILLTEKHFLDDWEDERKVSGWIGTHAFCRRAQKIEKKYKRQAEAIEKSLAELSAREKENCSDLDEIARPFGELMAELFVWQEDAFEKILRRFGFYLGKYIYLMDAFMDLEEDKRKGCFNPLKEWEGRDGYDETIKKILDHTIRMAIVEFEKLPLEQDVAILRNILYEGVWTAYERKPNHDE